MVAKTEKELPPVTKKATNPNRINMTYDEAIEDNRRIAEKAARIKAAGEEIDKELEAEDKVKKTKKVKKETTATNEEV